MKRAAFIAFLLSASSLFAVEDERVVERARGVVGMKLHLMATDLLDELIFRWSQNPPLGKKSRVIVMNVETPLGLNSEFSAFLENHLFQLLIHNQATGIEPTHCHSCGVITAYADSSRTIITRGAELPNIEDEKDKVPFALYIDFTLERSKLVLRSRLVSRLAAGKIVHAETLVTDSAQPPSLRDPRRLVSVEAQRKEYVGILQRSERARLSIGTKLTLFQFNDAQIFMPPLPWLLVGVDVFPSEARDWYMNFALGFTSVPEEATGNTFAARYGSRLSPRRSDLISPETYWFVSMDYFEIRGNAARTLIGSGRQSSTEFLATLNDESISPVFGTGSVSLGLEVQLARLTKIGVFLGRMIQTRNDGFFPSDYHFYGLEMGVSL